MDRLMGGESLQDFNDPEEEGVSDNMAEYGEPSMSGHDEELRGELRADEDAQIDPWVESLLDPAVQDVRLATGTAGAEALGAGSVADAHARIAWSGSGVAVPEPAVVDPGQAELEQQREAGADDMLAQVVVAIGSDPRWTTTGRMVNEWASSAGARLRVTWSGGEVTATFLEAGWEGMATFQRSQVTERIRVRGVEGLVELGFALVEYGELGARRGGRRGGGAAGTVLGGGAEDVAGAGGPLSEGAGLPIPGRSADGEGAAEAAARALGPVYELPVAPVSVRLPGVDVVSPTQPSLWDSGMLPTRAHETDAGLDLYTVGQHWVVPGTWYDLPCGIAVEIPEHCWGMVIGRSSTLRKKGLHVPISVIDPGYRGPLFVQVQTLRNEGDPVQVGDKERIGQLVLVPNVTPMFRPVWVEKLSDSPRGSSGFGSSGR